MLSKKTILVVEDDQTISDFIETVLTVNEYSVIKCTTGKEAMMLVVTLNPDVVLLDLGLPDIDGIEVLKHLRQVSEVSVVVVSARDNERDKVMALDLGADDYITKPFGTSELLARIRTALRHHNRLNDGEEPAKRFELDDFCIDFDKRMIVVGGSMIHLTKVEYKIVEFLARNPGRVLTYDSILNEIWGPFAQENDNRILRVNMANIRRKIEKNPAQPKYILTEVGVGYRMMDSEI